MATMKLGAWGHTHLLQTPRSHKTTRTVRVAAIRTRETPEANPTTQESEILPLRPAADAENEDLHGRELIDEPSVVQRAVRSAYRRTLLELSSLPRAMGVMFGIAVLSALGTIIEQGRDFQFYVDSYPAGESQMLGFLNYKLILFLQLDHIYSAPYFYGLIAVLVAQLMACTVTRQWPIAKVNTASFKAALRGSQKDNAEILPDANIQDLGIILTKKGYEIFLRNGSLYGFKSLVGRLAPIGVHAALLLTIAGICWGVLGGFKGTAFLPEGREIVVQEFMRPNSLIAVPPSGSKKTLRVDDFTIDYRSDGSIAQFYSDLSVLDSDGTIAHNKRISVNDPFRFEGVTMYQTDWGMSALGVTVESSALPDGKQTVRFPMASLKTRSKGSDKVFATFIPTPGTQNENSTPQGVSVLANDFQTVIVYDSSGQFAGVRRPGSGTPIEVSGMKITIDDIVGSTGLEIKYDPGVPLVYTGFAGLMITTILSYLSHAQIWALQDGRDLHVAGRSNRAGVLFQRELSAILDSVPDSGSPSGNNV